MCCPSFRSSVQNRPSTPQPIRVVGKIIFPTAHDLIFFGRSAHSAVHHIYQSDSTLNPMGRLFIYPWRSLCTSKRSSKSPFLQISALMSPDQRVPPPPRETQDKGTVYFLSRIDQEYTKFYYAIQNRMKMKTYEFFFLEFSL